MDRFVGIIERPRNGELIGSFNDRFELIDALISVNTKTVKVTGYIKGKPFTNRVIRKRILFDLAIKG